ncbi:double-stranded RNA-binding protein 1 isoform X1 [Jatropha curcas]|uniref:double-stranded RNA-binding protein 1 isoform X1 n=1 Tax=Jatropha curcas TaxID=180498 RepID=UPI0009D67B24|nr:double-stranded RNA-binding protein 1 isoform X1 [Jatropha curcas]
MYKTKLQELCQKRQWALPKYSTMKDGPDHNPRFKSSVSVNSHSFDSPFPYKSSKQAQNEAAKIAFLHFTSPSPGIKTNFLICCSDSLISVEPNVPETYNSSDTQSHDLTVENADSCQYKSQLQSYAYWQGFDFPLYSSITEGSGRSTCFKATVIIDGHAFESPHFFTTLNEAENSAAKAALMSILTDNFQEDDSGSYKNLLQETTQKEGLSIPLYKTIKTGPSHLPTFFSSVEVEGKKYYGKAGNSKKEAEVKAAKVAYTFLKDSAMSKTSEITSSTLVTDESLESEQHSAAESKDKSEEVNLPEAIQTNLRIDSKDPILSHSASVKQKMEAENFDSSSSCSKPVTTVTQIDISDFSISSSTMGKTTAPGSYLLCERVRVYLSYPNITFPKGITVLPISDDKWVAVSLEFPNEQSY